MVENKVICLYVDPPPPTLTLCPPRVHLTSIIHVLNVFSLSPLLPLFHFSIGILMTNKQGRPGDVVAVDVCECVHLCVYSQQLLLLKLSHSVVTVCVLCVLVSETAEQQEIKIS